MTTALGRTLKRRFAVPYACYKLATSRRSFIHESGWIESIRTSSPCDPDGNPVPWMNYSMVEFLSDRLRSDHHVFEFGSGFSTCFYADHCGEVTSVEYNTDWFALVRQMIPENASVSHVTADEDGQYCRAVQQTANSFHVIVVDGHDRNHCIDQSLPKLTEDGVIVLDDSDRPEYECSFAKLHELGFKQLTIAGIKPNSACRHETTIFYRPSNCFGI